MVQRFILQTFGTGIVTYLVRVISKSLMIPSPSVQWKQLEYNIFLNWALDEAILILEIQNTNRINNIFSTFPKNCL